MSALAITSALIALSVQCAPTVAPGTLLSFARAESGLDPLAIHSNTDGRSYHPTTKAEAVAIASRLIAAGHSIDAGFMQINSSNLGWLGLSITQAFDLCPSIQAGARVLHTGYDPCMDAGGEAQACLKIAASTYNTGSPTRGFANGYVMRIAATAAHVIPAIAIAIAGQQADAPSVAAPAPKPTSSPAPCAPPSPDDWHLSADQAACAPSEGGWHADDAKPSADRVDEADPPASATPPRSEKPNVEATLRP
jgi:type IV secretion system protein VirB1